MLVLEVGKLTCQCSLTLLVPQKSDDPPRLWWCPTGPFVFLPIHAAGRYRSNPVSVAEYVISSYTSTLAALLATPSPPSTANNPLRVTAVVQPATPGHSPLPFTKDELLKIKNTVPGKWLMSFGATQSASVNRVLAHLQTSSIVHFAGHGIQDMADPLQSALLIGAEQLTVSQIMEKSGTSHNTPELVGKTNMGLDDKLPDESMHLVATLLFAGFKSVVATMWMIQDPNGPDIADVFYGYLFHNTDAKSDTPVFPDLRESAQALHLAVVKLRPKVSFARWVLFVHHGL
ncbi:CHAT domain-containing protein [Mycena sp. CBHHK59/15]|nr:CHAT domain-containing protein [Mycena sp. CBHHK59/15]